VDLEGPGYPETVSVWAERNGCDKFSDTEAGESVIHRVYDCPRGAEVEFSIVVGGGHTWPGSQFSANIESITGPTTFEIDWNELAWEFFQRFALD
jgi:polyhydroxybutyrate depolymerase